MKIMKLNSHPWLGIFLTVLAFGAAADAIPPRIAAVTLDIRSQPIGDALNEFGQQSGIQILLYSEVAKGLTGPALVGAFTPDEALLQLLSNTGLTYSYVNARTIAIHSVISTVGGREALRKEAAPPVMRLANLQISEEHSIELAQETDTRDVGHQNSSDERRRPRIEEVVVTAQKRTERLQDVPISISVLGGSDLDRSTAEGITESLNSVPGVLAQASYIGGGTQIAVRGVAASSTLLHGSSPIAYYLDSVPFGLIKTSVAPDSNAYDLERVEVLRGPQGTLYGASALNGVVRVLSKDADLEEFQFKARTSASGTERGGDVNYRADLAANVPIVEGKLAARAVVGYDNQSGWIDRPNEKDANDAELRNMRLKLNAQPIDELSVGLSVWLSRAKYGAPSMANDNGRYSIAAYEPMLTDYDTYGLKIGYDFTGFAVTSMTSYLDYTNSGVLDLAPLGAPGIPFINKIFSRVFSQEVNINSGRDGSWRWSLGGIYRDATDRTFQRIPGIFAADVDFDDNSQSFAVFGEITRVLVDDTLELTAGLRYFEDDETVRENIQNTGIPTDPLIRASSTFRKTTPRVVLSWRPSSQLTAYASYAEGFRSGFQQQPNVITTAPQIPPVDADSLKNYEVGAKGALWDGRLSIDTALYYIDWQDVQSDNAILINGIPVIALVNGGSASGIGVDFGLTTEPLSGLELGVNFSWNDLAWDREVIVGGDLLFASGDRLSLSPEYTAGASADYTFPLGGGEYQCRLSASANYTSESYIRITTGFGQGDAILIGRASFAISFPARWTATLYVDNLNNEQGAVQQAPFAVADWTSRPRPRTFGMQLEYGF